jgi:hypothetical protein
MSRMGVRLPRRTPVPGTAPRRHSRAATRSKKKMPAKSRLPTAVGTKGECGVRSWN